MLGGVAQGIDRAHYPGIVMCQTMVCQGKSEALLEADRLAGCAIEDLGPSLAEHCLEEHLTGVLEVEKDRANPSFVVI